MCPLCVIAAISLHLHHLSSIIIIRCHFSLYLKFIISLPPPWIAPSLSFICIFCSLLRYLYHLPEGVVTAQTRWSRGSRWSGWQTAQNWPLSSQSYPAPKPQGVWEGTHLPGRMRGRGQGEGPRAEGGLYNSRGCHQLILVLKQFSAVGCNSELFEARAHTLSLTWTKRWGGETDVSYCRQEYEREFKEIREWALEKETQWGMDDSLWRHISHCTSRQRCLHGLFSAVSSNGSSRVCVCVCLST